MTDNVTFAPYSFGGSLLTYVPASDGDGTLDPALKSIADLTTARDQMIYTTDTDTYAVTGLTAAGRSLVSAATIADQQSSLGLLPGLDVQTQSAALDTVHAIAASGADQMIYTTGNTYVNTPVTSYARSDILTATSAADLGASTGFIAGPVSTTDRLVKVDGSNSVAVTGLSVDASDNLTGVNDVTVGNNLVVTGNLDGITTAERAQLVNIDTTTINTSQWGYLGDMNQGVSMANTPVFTGLDALSSRITSVLTPVSGTDAANKAYVDTVASTGTAPLELVNVATIAVLPNSPGYSSQVITSTGGPGSLTVDGVTVVVGDRVLVKTQADSRENGIYTATDDGATPGPNWELTRSTDFNQAAMPVPAGTTVFVKIRVTATTSGSTWSLQATVGDVEPLTDAVAWVQIGGQQTFTAGNGINPAALGGGTIATDITTRLKYTSGELDLSTVTVGYGGTGAVTHTSGNVLVGQGASAVDSSKAAPSGAFVGTTDTQTLTNKTATDATNNITARALFSGSGAGSISTYAAVAPTAGQVLTATSGTLATWQTPEGVQPDRTLFVFPTAAGSSPYWSTLEDALTDAVTLTPTAANAVIIFMYPGTYTEDTPLAVPAFVTISAYASTSTHVVIRPSAPATTAAILTTSGNTQLSGLRLDGFDGATGFATIGVDSSGAAGLTDSLTTMTVVNCSVAGFRVSGNGVFGSHILNCGNTIVGVTSASPFVCTSGYELAAGAILRGNATIASGLATGSLTNGVYVHDKFTTANMVNTQISIAVNGLVIGGAGTEENDIAYPTFIGTDVRFNRISEAVMNLLAKSVVLISTIFAADDLGVYPGQVTFKITNPSLPADPNRMAFNDANAFNSTNDIANGAPNNGAIIGGTVFLEESAVRKMILYDNVSVGRLTAGRSLIVGGGEPHVFAMYVLQDNGGVFTSLVGELNDTIPAAPVANDIATTGVVNLASAPATIDGVTPTSGVTLVLVKDGSTANAGTTSVDNGVYVWNGTGNAMTRSSVFATGQTFDHDTFFTVNGGTVNYGQLWRIDASSMASAVVVVGTTAFALLAQARRVFPDTPSDDDAMYIGIAVPSLLFPGIGLRVSAPITLSSGVLSDTIVWEYWNGSAWTDVKLMSVDDGAPYANYGNETFALGNTSIGVSEHSRSYKYRFGTIDDWATTDVSGLNALWVRCRLLSAANLDQNPVISQLRLFTNNTETNEDGFVEYFGTSRPVQTLAWTPQEMLPPNGGGFTDPTSHTVEFGNSGGNIIRGNLPNCKFRPSRDAALSQNIILVPNLDTSEKMRVTVNYFTGNGSGDVVVEVLYVFARAGTTFGNIDGSVADATVYSSGIQTVTITAGTGVQDAFVFDLDISVATVGADEMWFQFSRTGNAAGDTFSDDLVVTSVESQYKVWCNGSYGYA